VEVNHWDEEFRRLVNFSSPIFIAWQFRNATEGVPYGLDFPALSLR
jgi:hypothetical protein